jgi:flagellar FliL protein
MAEAESPAGKKKSSFMSTLIEWLVVTMIAGGAGFGLAAMNPPPRPAQDAADKAALGKLASNRKSDAKAEAAAACAPGGASMIDLPPIVTNVAVPADTWVRLEAAIVFDPKALPHPDVVAAEIAADELAYLRTVSVAELQGPIGLENIRQDLRDRALVRSGGKVADLLLKTLVLQ